MQRSRLVGTECNVRLVALRLQVTVQGESVARLAGAAKRLV